MSIYKPCDIRGVVGQDWGPGEAHHIGHSLGRMLSRRGQSTICVGGDFRRSTPEFKQTLVQGLVETGTHVIDVGQLPTPAIYFAANQLHCANAAIVTASHNAGKYNGIKFMLAGRPAVPELISELTSQLERPSLTSSRGTVRRQSIEDDYRTWVVHLASQFLARRTQADSQRDSRDAPLHILLDTMEGAMTLLAPQAFQLAGYTSNSLSTEIDPDFSAREPNPANDRNLQRLLERLAHGGYDLGIAFDGDGDRVIFVDPTVGIVRPEQIAVVFARSFFQQPTIVYDLKCASIVRGGASETGGTAIMRPSGHGFIKTSMIDQRADLGVEVSGHHFFGVLDGGDDGLFAALLISGLLQASGRRLANLVADAPWPSITPDIRIPYDGDAQVAVETIAETCGTATTRLDGVRAEYEDGWALARASITEPAITMRLEGRDVSHLRQIATEFLRGVPEFLPHVLERIHE